MDLIVPYGKLEFSCIEMTDEEINEELSTVDGKNSTGDRIRREIFGNSSAGMKIFCYNTIAEALNM